MCDHARYVLQAGTHERTARHAHAVRLGRSGAFCGEAAETSKRAEQSASRQNALDRPDVIEPARFVAWHEPNSPDGSEPNRLRPNKPAISRARRAGTGMLDRERLNMPPSAKIGQTEGVGCMAVLERELGTALICITCSTTEMLCVHAD